MDQEFKLLIRRLDSGDSSAIPFLEKYFKAHVEIPEQHLNAFLLYKAGPTIFEGGVKGV